MIIFRERERERERERVEDEIKKKIYKSKLITIF
jgi:hypothetical protein